MEILSLLKDALIVVCGAPIANASNTDANTTRLHLGRYQNVLFIAPIDDSAITGVATIAVETNSVDSDTGMVALTGATATVTSGANDDLNTRALVVDIKNVRGPWVQLVRTSSVANIAFGDVIAIFYNGSVSPVTQGATVAASAFALGT